MPELQIIALTPAVYAAPRRECAIAVAAARTGAIGILDIEGMPQDFDLPAALSILQNAGGIGATGIRCGIKQVQQVLNAICSMPNVEFEREGREKAQLQYIALSVDQDSDLAGVIASLKEFGLKVFAEVISVEEALRAEAAGADAVVGKGSESSGRAGEETAFVLLQRLRKSVELPVWIQGGIGTHTIAACAVGGAQGVVLDGQLLLARESPLSAKQRAHLSRADGSESSEWGQSAAFASSLAEKGCTVSGIIAELRQSLSVHLEQADVQKILSAAKTDKTPLAESHGTRFPILQGAMTRVSDTAQFASCVAQGGALPFLALALMRGRQVDKLLSECKVALTDQSRALSWGVGILGFVPEPLWHEQIEAVLKAKPPYALIAGGRPDQSKMLEQVGIKTYLHVPSPLLLNAFIDEGARRFVFEGRECGGHVGPRSSFILWQLMIDVLLKRVTSKADAANYHIVFAGGIHDSISAAMVATLAAPLAAAGMKVGVLVGTAYLFTQEAVSSGAIVKTFQRKAIECKTTALLDTGPGHSIRVIDSPYRKTFEAQRVQLQNENKSWQEIREELELMNLGRLRVASKGLTRAVAKSAVQDLSFKASQASNSAQSTTEATRFAELSAQVEPKQLLQVSDEQQWQDGMYMIGQVAALHDKTLTIEQLHLDICEGGQKHLETMLGAVEVEEDKISNSSPATVEILSSSTSQESSASKTPIAIVGMSCMLPQANDVEKFWLNILNRVDSITEVPEKYWDWKKLYDPDPLAADKIVSKWGGFLEAIEFDPTTYGIPPSSMGSVDPMQLLILEAARRALTDAGYEERNFPRSRTSVILANAGHGPVTALYSLRSMLDWKLSGLSPEQRKQIEEILPEWTEDSFPGTLGNVTAGRVSNRFDLGGLNFAVDAACASSLAALYVGVNDLRGGGSDVVLLAATDTHNQPGDYLSFSKTHALSPDGRCKTFDATANGIVISEGIAVLVLKRLADAEADGDTIYAIIKGVGGSSDGRALSLTAPRPAGQVLALKRAYEDAGVPSSSVSLIEAHGTGTVAGDKAEIEALNSMFSAGGTAKQMCAVGSVKSNIGHTKCTAGLASIIKVAKALHHKILPATIGVKTPNAACNFGESPFYISSESRPWLSSTNGQPRRAGVSAFGFGGTNFHTVLEEYTTNSLAASMCFPSELFVFRAPSLSALKKQIVHFESDINGQLNLAAGRIDDAALLSLFAFKAYLRDAERQNTGGITLAVVASSVTDLLKKLKTVSGMPEEQMERGLKDPQGVYLQDIAKGASAAEGSVAFLFPGQGSQRLNMLADVSMYFPQVRQTFEQADYVYETVIAEENGGTASRLSRYIFPPPSFTEEEAQKQQQQLTDTSVAQVAIGVANLAMHRLLRDFAIEPDMLAGHSYGEYAALTAAGAISEEQLVKISVLRGKLMNRCAKGSMAAITGNVLDVKAALAQLGQDAVMVANQNAPQQCVLSGPDNEIDVAIKYLREKGFDARKLPVSAAFHSASMEEVRDELKVALKECNFSTPEHPVYSNLTAQPHKADGAMIMDNLVEHTVKPVQFMQEIEQMYADGARVFIEVGPGGVLTNLVENILADKPHLAVATDRSGRNGVTQLQHALAALAANGANLNLGALFENRCLELEAIEKMLRKAKETAASNKKSTRYMVNSYSIERIDEGKLLPVGGQVDRRPALQSGVQQPSSRQVKSTRAGVEDAHFESPRHGDSVMGTPSWGLRNEVMAAAESILPLTSNLAVTPAISDGSIEGVMLQFQQTMAQMTNNFLQAQQNVMLAYLNNVSAPPSSLDASMMAAKTQILSAPAAEQSVTSAALVPAASLAQSAVATSTEESQPALNAEELIAGLIDIVSERTGYPPEMLEPNLDLEADLGIDSIKRIEILSTFRKMLPEQVVAQLEGSVEKLASTRTLAGIFDWIREAMSLAEAVPQHTTQQLEPQQSVPQITATEQPASQEIAYQQAKPPMEGQISRGLVGVIDLPPAAIDSNFVLKGTVLVHGGNAEIVALLQNRGFNTVSTDDVQPDQISRRDLVGLMFFDAITHSNYKSDATARFAQFLKVWKKHLVASDKTKPFLLAATRLGGTFGFTAGMSQDDRRVLEDDIPYEQAGVVGLIKTLSREWTDVHSRVVDFAATAGFEEIVNCMVDEANDIVVESNKNSTKVAPLTEVGYLKARRYGLQINPAELVAESSNSNIAKHLNSDSVILLTGGARGITAQLAIAMATHWQPTLILLGRQPLPGIDEFAHLESVRELKSAIMEKMQQAGQTIILAEVEEQYNNVLKDREIKQTLAAIEKAGATVEYYCLNVCDEEDFAQFIDAVYEKYGRLDGVVHGAGIIEDAYLMNKEIESFKRVVNTKIIPAKVLADKLRFDELQFLFFLSSVVSRTGNTGQADYVVANEVLNKLAVQLNRQHKSRVASLLWGPWNGGMARPELEKLFARYGWTMISNEQGRTAFMDELVTGDKGAEEVLLVAQVTSPTTSTRALTPTLSISSTSAASKESALSGVAVYGGNGNGNGNGNNGHADGNGNGNGSNGHDHASNLMIRAGGARLFNSYALEKEGDATAVHFTLSTQEDLYLNDHCLDGLPVLPMAMATELMAEAGALFDNQLRTARVTDLRIPSGIIFDEVSKNFVIRLEPVGDCIKAYLSSVGSKERAAPARTRFICNIVLSDQYQPIKIDSMQLPKGFPLTYLPQQFANADADLPPISEAYQKWFFHGPMFQGIQEIISLGADGIAGTVLGSSPSECLHAVNGEHWLVDPILLDSAMQLAGIWAWKYLDMMVLPTGFRSLSIFGAPTREVHHVIVRIPHMVPPAAVTPTRNNDDAESIAATQALLSDHSELLCDLAIYGPRGEMIMLLEGLSGIGSRSFNRLVTQPKELRK